jgi:crotonobetainyl-CoA:carnitine CoA-transferase CaiB-like acyl-CoA transferase
MRRGVSAYLPRVKHGVRCRASAGRSEPHPRPIYVSISGVGESGPYAGKRVYDPNIQALSGFADVQAEPKTRRPQMIRTIVADKTTAIFAAQAVTVALFARERTGLGQHIRLAMLDTM